MTHEHWPLADHPLSGSTVHFLSRIDDAVVQAAEKMDFADLDPDASDEQHEEAYEERFHCGTCVVRTVMETVWPPVDDYIQWLEHLVVASWPEVPAKRRWWRR